ncbi:MAG TPA: DUF2934 domain-containing protein [Candidatus Sulfotelmatobacter sp.]|nr:DUF2934 domain-containing protein [Candidatus Sulfotelmatobacter sp.]
MKPSLGTSISQGKQNLSQESNVETLEKVRLRAYQLYEQRGRGEGHDVEDWLKAESEVIAKPVAA